MSSRGVKFYNSIGFRLSALVAAVILTSVIALSYLSAAQSLERETENYTALMSGAATAYAAAVSDAVGAEDRAATLSNLRGIRDLPNVVQVDVTQPNGLVFAELGTGSFLVSKPGADISLWRADTVRVDTPIMQSGIEIGRLGMLVDLKPLRAEIVRTLITTILYSAIVIIIGIAIAQVFVSQLTSPIKRLTNIMAGIRDGDTEHTVELRDRKDETGLMTQTFLDMMGSIKDRDAQISRHMETLEETVEERTHDLRLAKEDAEAANAAKSDFLATMSHEIRTPMNGMMVMAEMLGAADLTPRHRRYAEIIHRSGNSLLTIINDILDLSKIESGQLDLEYIPVSPERLLTDVASLFWERARSKNLELATYVSPRVPEEIIADPTRLNQIVSNLVNNALKFTEKGGVTIKLDATVTTENEVRLLLEIVDTGIGIPDDKIDHIFESFSQADQSTTRRFGGTGLGLTVCQRLVSAMSGTIDVTSELGQGSKFAVSWPAALSKHPPQSEKQTVRVGILLPDGVTRSAIENTLSDFGCELVTTNPDAWIVTSDSFVAQTAPVILLSDIGDTSADKLLTDGQVADSIPHPYCRADITTFLDCVANKSFRGIGATQGGQEDRQIQSFEGLRVLAADDNAVNREVLREALSTLKADATFVEDGEQALEAVCKQDFDLIFMDGSMPVMDGFEATRRIRAYEAETSKRATPLFALTAQVAGMSNDAWEQAGADGHILKPFNLEKLTEVMTGVSIPESAPRSVETANNETSLLDMATVATLEQLGAGDGSVRDKVWTMFEDKAPAMLSKLHRLMAEGDLESVAKQAHAFKSMALSSGLSGLAGALQELEAQSKTAAPDLDLASKEYGIDRLVKASQSAMNQHRARAA